MAWYAGYPREKIQWYPTIDPEKCVECGICMNCGAKVYKWTEKGPVVDQPYKCTVGCTTCATLCQGNAITFPDKKSLRELYQKARIWAKVKNELTKQGLLEVEETGTENQTESETVSSPKNTDESNGGCGCGGIIKTTDESTENTTLSKEEEGCGCGTGSVESSANQDNGECGCGCGGDYPDESIENNPSKPKTVADEDFIEKLENYAHSIGITSIGYAKVPPELINDDKSILFSNAIVLTMEMDDELIKTDPGAAAQALNDEHYEKLGRMTYQIAEYLREEGFAAEAAHPYGGVVKFTPLAQEAGLGWVGKSGLLITPVSGPRQKISAVFTSIDNLPIKTVDEHSWIEKYCKHCGKCIKACPENALIQTETCCNSTVTEFIEERCIGCSEGCTYCIEDCPFDEKEYGNIKERFDRMNAKLREKQNKKFNTELWDNWAGQNSSLFAGLTDGASIAISMTQNNEKMVNLEKGNGNLNVTIKNLKKELESPKVDLMFEMDEKDLSKLLNDPTLIKFIDLISSGRIKVYAFKTQPELISKGYMGFLNRLGLSIGGKVCCG